MNQGFDSREIIAAVESLLTGQITMGNRVHEFEAAFASYLGAKYAVMVNSGSSANLLAIAAACNPARARRLQPGDEVLVPAVCWSTSVWPLIQMNLRPVFVDADPDTLNVSIDDFRRRITGKTRALMAVHVLGNSAPMAELLAFTREHDLLLIEDTCESLGARADGRFLGTLGDFGTYSFYYSHHITTGEGGIVLCASAEDYELLKCLRAHGWSRELANREQIQDRYGEIDPRFLFVNLGYNVRPLEVQAAIGLEQLQRLEGMNRVRNANRDRLVSAMESHVEWRGQYGFTRPSPGTAPAWFGLTLLCAEGAGREIRSLLPELERRGVETRPIISGNFARQPALALLGVDVDPADFPGAERIHHQGFFIGLHSVPLDDTTIERLATILLTS